MPKDDTTLGGAVRRFPETTWGMVSRLLADEKQVHRSALEDLCRRYWKPVYYYLRTKWLKSNEDAKDIAQAFFLWLFEGDALHHYSPGKGGFRKYLKMILKSFTINHVESMKRLKRGGGLRIWSLEDERGIGDSLPDPRSDDPERQFDLAWKHTLTQTALDKTRAHSLSSGRELAVRIYDEYELAAPESRPSYAELSERLSVKESDVRNQLFSFREALRAEIRCEVANLTADDRELDEEWGALFRGGG